MAGHRPGYFSGGPKTALLCYGYQPSVGIISSYPVRSPTGEKRQLLLLGVVGHEAPSVQAVYFDSDISVGEPCETEVVRLETDLFSRLKRHL